MKKIIAVLILLSLMVVLCSCNMSMGLGSFEFNKIHIDTYNQSRCFTVEKWYDNGTGIEVKTKEAGNMFFSEGVYFLIEGECPFCDHPTEKGGGE